MFAQEALGMTWIPILALWVIGWVPGIIAVGANLWRPASRMGFVSGAVACTIGLLSPGLVFIAGGQVVPSVYLLLLTPVLPGMLGLALSRVRPGAVLCVARGIGIAVAVTAMSAGGYYAYVRHLGSRDMIALLAGSEQVQIVGFSIEGQGQRVECTDRALCDYLAGCLRKGTQHFIEVGDKPYSFTFDFASGGRYHVTVGHVIEHGLILSIPEANPGEYGWPTHKVIFCQPVPERIEMIWAFLYQGAPKADGRVMRVREGCAPRIQR